MALTGQLGVADSQLANIELGGVTPLLLLAQYPTPVFEVNFTDDPIACHRDVVMGCFPMAYWRLNETSGTTAADESGNGKPATYTGGFTLNAAGALGDSDPAVTLNGSTGYVEIPAYSEAFNLTAAYSYSVWAYPTATRDAAATDAAGVFCHEYPGTGSVPFVLTYGRLDSVNVFANQFWAGHWNSVGGWTIIIDPTPATLNEWVHFVVTWDATATTRRFVFYRNGVEIGYSSSPTLVAAATSGTKTFIGQRHDSASTFPGRLDDAAFFNRTLSPLEAAKLYASGSVRRDKEDGFVDYSDRVRGFTVRRGRSSEVDRVEAGSLTIVLDNSDGEFDPDPDNGVVPMRMARLKCRFGPDTYPLLRGYIERYRYLYPGFDADAVVELTITDGFKALAQQGLNGFLRQSEFVGPRLQAVLQASAIPEDLQDIDTAYIYSAALAPARSSDTNVELPPIILTGTLSNGSAVVTGLSSTTALVAGMAVSGKGIPSGTTIASVDSGTQITLSAVTTLSATKLVGGLPNSAVLTSIDDTSVLSVGMAVDLGNNSNGDPIDQPGSTIASIDSGSQVTMNQPTYNVTFRGSGQPGGFALATFTAATSQSLTFTSVTLTVSGALEHIRAIEASELGLFLLTGDGRFVYQGSSYRDAQTVLATFGDTDFETVEIPYSDLPISYDETNLANEYHVTNTYHQKTSVIIDPASIRRYFPRTETIEQLWQQNFYRLRQRTSPVPRTETLQVKPAFDPARLWPAILSLDVSDKVDVERHHSGGTDVLAGYSQFVEGIAHDASPGEWVVTLAVSPEPE